MSSAVPGVGLVCCLHTPPIREAEQEIKTLADSHDVLLGDFNTGPFPLLKSLSRHKGVSRPSYLPAKSFKEAGAPPSFDHILVSKRGRGSIRLANRQAVELPRMVQLDPRQHIRKLGWCSDHVPVEAELDTADGRRLRFATWNVADPLYFSEMHASTPELAENICRGFDPSEEDSRLAHVRSVAREILSRNDVVALQEVPIDLASLLVEDASHMEVRRASDRSSKDEDGERAAQVMLFFGPSPSPLE